jgi:hypothetical protein
MIDSGVGYTSIPTVTISSPPISGIGTYRYNEIVAGSISGATAIVNSWDSTTNILKISKVTGKFIPGENIIGSLSNANRQLRFVEEFNTTDPYAQNDEIEIESDQIIDFSERNPFGSP